MYLDLRKYKNDWKILTIILVPDFCPLKPEIARFSIGFRLNISVKVTKRDYFRNKAYMGDLLSYLSSSPVLANYRTVSFS